MNYVTRPIPENKPEVNRVVRHWGTFNQYAFNQEVTVSLMVVQPDKRLSFQSHTGRAELWIVLDPGAEIQLNDDILHPQPGDEVFIPANARHRLSCNGTTEIRVLEIAFGNWQQADITRYDDDFGRPEQGE